MHEPSSTRRETAQGALADAASQLRASLRTDEEDAGETDFDLPERQWTLLIEWAKSQDLILPSSFVPPDQEGGREHRVRYDDTAGLWWKTTLPNLAGYTVSWSKGSPYLHNALPLDYLERLLWQNQLFGDDVMLRGLWSPAPHDWCVATTQPHVTGTIGDEHSLAEGFKRAGFSLLPWRGVGYAASIAARAEGFDVWDIHPANVLLTADGLPIPFDVLITRSPTCS